MGFTDARTFIALGLVSEKEARRLQEMSSGHAQTGLMADGEI
jgi:hypothetical protein